MNLKLGGLVQHGDIEVCIVYKSMLIEAKTEEKYLQVTKNST